MKRRLLSFLVATLLVPSLAFSEMPVKYRVSLSESGAGLVRGLTFHAPFTDPANPLTLYKGTGSLTFSRTSSATYVHPTTVLVTTAADNVLRIEANGALIEGARTNVKTGSDNFDNTTYWYTKENTTVVSDNAISPDGTRNADKLLETSATDYHRVNGLTNGGADQVAWTMSAFVKAAGRNFAEVQIQDGNGNGVHIIANLTIGAVTTEATLLGTGYATPNGGVIALSDGWYRVWVSAVKNAEANLYTFISTSSDGSATYIVGDNTVGLYIWGAQLEAGAFPSSYIPTANAGAITRSADSLTFPTEGNISGTVGTVAVSYKTIADAGATSQYILDLNNARPALFINGADEKLSINDGATTTSFGTADTHGTVYFGASRWSATDSKQNIVRGAGTVVSGTFDNDINLGTNATIGDSGTTTSFLWGHVKNLRIWNRALTVTELQAVTR